MNMEEQLEQPPAKKPRMDICQEQPENGQGNDVNLANSPEEMDKVLGTSTMDLPSRHPLPLELNCEIFKCLQLPIQRKFIGGLGRGIYGMFGQKLIIKIRNPHANLWDAAKSTTDAAFYPNGLKVLVTRHYFFDTKIYAEQAFPISGQHCRLDNFPGTICYYYEINLLSPYHDLEIGLSDGTDHDDVAFGDDKYPYPNYYVMECGNPPHLEIDRKCHLFELPEGAIQPKFGPGIDIYGCGLFLYPNDKLTVFFTLNGKLLGKPIPISPSVDCLFPTVSLWGVYIEANFGDDPANPFKYDIHKCPFLSCARNEIEEEKK